MRAFRRLPRESGCRLRRSSLPQAGEVKRLVPISPWQQDQYPLPEVAGRCLVGEMAAEVSDRFMLRQSPTRRGWLNQAEIEIGIFARQCLGAPEHPRFEDLVSGSEGMEPADEP